MCIVTAHVELAAVVWRLVLFGHICCYLLELRTWHVCGRTSDLSHFRHLGHPAKLRHPERVYPPVAAPTHQRRDKSKGMCSRTATGAESGDRGITVWSVESGENSLSDTDSK